MEGRIREYADKAKADREEEESAAAVLVHFATAQRKSAGKKRQGASRKMEAAAHDAVPAVPPPPAAPAPAGDVYAFPVEPAPTSLQKKEDVVAALKKLMQGEASSCKKNKAAEAVVDATRRATPAVSPPPASAPAPAGGSQFEPVFEPAPLAVHYSRATAPPPPRGYRRAPAPTPPAPERVVSAAPSPPRAPAPVGNTCASQSFAPISCLAPLPFQYYFPHAMTPPAPFIRAPAPSTPQPWEFVHQSSASLSRLSQLQAIHSLNTLRPLMFPSQHQPAPAVSTARLQPFYTMPSFATAATNTTEFQPNTMPGTFAAPQPTSPMYNWPANTAVGQASSGGLPNPPTILGARQFATGGTYAIASSSATPALPQAYLDLYRVLEVQAAGGLENVRVDDPGKQEGRRKKKRGGA